MTLNELRRCGALVAFRTDKPYALVRAERAGLDGGRPFAIVHLESGKLERYSTLRVARQELERKKRF